MLDVVPRAFAIHGWFRENRPLLHAGIVVMLVSGGEEGWLFGERLERRLARFDESIFSLNYGGAYLKSANFRIRFHVAPR